MRQTFFVLVVIVLTLASIGLAAQTPATGPYRILKTAKVGGAGGFDYVFADSTNRRLYIPRTGQGARVSVFDLDTLAPVGEIPNTSARGATVDLKSNHGFSSSKPVVMWDAKTLQVIKTIDVQGNPDGIMFDPFNQRVYVFSHAVPHTTVINAVDGTVLGTIDLGGAPEQAVTDGAGHVYVDVEDKENVAVIDAKSMMVTNHYDVTGKGGTCAGLAIDNKNHILFASCRNPANMVMLNAADGKILGTLSLGAGTDGAQFNPATMEAFSSQGDGTLTIVKENSPTSFVVEQNLQTMVSGKTLTLDTKTNHILIIAAEFGPAAPGARGRGPMVADSFSILLIGK